ncbi:MAG: 30S ribosomal protein S17 [Deltaproteobacteria bacterium]|nr:30S ribosomal protein S17 [Deltaproteobacteria bacterium]
MSESRAVGKDREKAGKQRTIRGTVTSDKMDKTRVVTVVRMVRHPVVGKFIRKTTKFMFHDEKNISKIGDEVLITPSRPLSARKSFQLLSVVKEASE